MTKQEIKSVISATTSSMTFIGTFANYNDLCHNGRREAGCYAAVGKTQTQYACDGKRWLKIHIVVTPKIMFNEHFGLQSAVIDGRKTMTRRMVVMPKGVDKSKITDAEIGLDSRGKVMATFYGRGDDGKRYPICDVRPRYQVGERVSIAQSYESLVAERPDDDYGNYYLRQFRYEKGWYNKMFVRSELMPRHILIKNVGIERIQDISDIDSLHEGIYAHTVDLDETPGVHPYTSYAYDARLGSKIRRWWFRTPHEAFAALICKMSGKKVWDSNPWVWVYEFEVEK